MTGVLKARVGGVFVPVESPAPATDEVWVGPDDPGVDSSYELWYDPDDDGPQYGSYAMGVTNLGGLIATATALSATAPTFIGSVANFYYASGRRYRLFFEINAMQAATLANGYFVLYIDGSPQSAAPWLTIPGGAGNYMHFSYEWYLEKYGMSAGLHTLSVYWSPQNSVAATIYTDLGALEVRDVGPANPMNPLTVTTPPAWIPAPFAAGWSSYGSGYQPAGYRRLGDTVWLRGLCQQTGAGTTMLTLPTGYRPLGGIVLGSHISSTGMVRFDINPSGTFVTSATISNGNWVSLEGINFSVTPG